MICIGIPICRPLYKNCLDKLASCKRSDPSNSDQYAPRTIGGTWRHNNVAWNARVDHSVAVVASDAQSGGRISADDRDIRVVDEYRVSSGTDHVV